MDENEHRLDLSPFEKSKQRLAEIRQVEAELKAKAAELERKEKEQAEEKEEVSASNSTQKPKRRKTGGRPKGRKPGSRRDVAEATGTSEGEQRRIERHVELAERYPFMQRPHWTRR